MPTNSLFLLSSLTLPGIHDTYPIHNGWASDNNRYATGPQTEDEDHPLAISFEDPKIIHTYSRDRFFASQIRRYTIVSWLEGEDRDSVSSKGNPVGATLKLGVEITAYENE